MLFEDAGADVVGEVGRARVLEDRGDPVGNVDEFTDRFSVEHTQRGIRFPDVRQARLHQGWGRVDRSVPVGEHTVGGHRHSAVPTPCGGASAGGCEDRRVGGQSDAAAQLGQARLEQSDEALVGLQRRHRIDRRGELRGALDLRLQPRQHLLGRRVLRQSHTILLPLIDPGRQGLLSGLLSSHPRAGEAFPAGIGG